MRINKFIANNSDYSRRKVDELIIIGKVFINGEKAKQGDLVQPEKDRIEIDNRIIEYREEKTYLMLNKPAGYITTRNDEYNRRTVMDLIPQDKNLKPVGRLDKDTEGLLLFSNDGEFINRLTHPRYECEKEYFAVIYGELSQADQNKLEKGIIVEEKRTSPAKIWIEKIENGETELRITIHEGRKRQIRKMFACLNHDVKYLLRLRVGKLELGSLPQGQYKIIAKKDLHAYKLD